VTAASGESRRTARIACRAVRRAAASSPSRSARLRVESSAGAKEKEKSVGSSARFCATP
jgi:hypothetical protein